MAIKTLQNNFTTPEQSKRLLEWGVPADSADCYLLRTHTKGDTFIVEVLHDELYSKKDKFTNMLEYLPCWSVGRLLDIYLLSVEMKTNIKPNALFFLDDNESLIENLMEWFETESFDFSKLEE